jgi:hypothetical protein
MVSLMVKILVSLKIHSNFIPKVSHKNFVLQNCYFVTLYLMKLRFPIELLLIIHSFSSIDARFKLEQL